MGDIRPLPHPQPNIKPQSQAETDRLSIELIKIQMILRECSARLNDVTQEIEVTGTTLEGRKMDFPDLVTYLHSELSGLYKGCSLDIISEYVAYSARDAHYNPILEKLRESPWDGEHRLDEVYSLLGLADDDTLSRTLVYKWLLQTVALLFNDTEQPFGAEGVLVLNGPQGAGKTSFFRHLALDPAWFLEGGTIKDNDKDTVRRVVTHWITELGEVESTLKSDISALKAFITNSRDTYRLPYGRFDRRTPRRTSLCATCNSDRYLIDPTGNRRFWSVPITKRIPYEDIQKLDALQLWREVLNTVDQATTQEEKAKLFRLEPSTQAALEKRNSGFEKPLKGELECLDILTQAEAENYVYTLQSVSQWREEWIDTLRPYSVQQISAALEKLGIKKQRKRLAGSANQSKVWELPTAIKAPSESRG